MKSSYEQGSNQAPFFESYKPALRQIFDTLGHGQDWHNNLEQTVAYMQKHWVPGDHWNPENQEQFSQQQETDARQLFRRVGLVDEVEPASGEYDQVIILGGMVRANRARVGFGRALLQSHAVSLPKNGQLMFWGGPRLRQEKEDLPTAQLIGELSKTKHPSRTNQWLERQLGIYASGNERALNTELEEGRAVLLDQLGNLSTRRAHIDLATSSDELPTRDESRDISHYELYSPDKDFQVHLLNARSVKRPMGQPRHTTEQCAKEWLETLPPEKNAEVLFVTSNPYIRRTTLVVNKVLVRAGRGDVRLVGCGPAAYDDAKPQLFMGEIGRLLFEDLNQSVGI